MKRWLCLLDRFSETLKQCIVKLFSLSTAALRWFVAFFARRRHRSIARGVRPWVPFAVFFPRRRPRAIAGRLWAWICVWVLWFWAGRWTFRWITFARGAWRWWTPFPFFPFPNRTLYIRRRRRRNRTLRAAYGGTSGISSASRSFGWSFGFLTIGSQNRFTSGI